MDRRLLPLMSFITLISYTILAHAQENQVQINILTFKQERFYDGSDFSLSFEPGIVDDAKEGFQGNFTVKLGCISEDTKNMGITCERLKKSQTKIFFEVDSNHFLFHIENTTEQFSASKWEPTESRSYIPLSLFDTNNELRIYFTSSILGIYNVNFYTYELGSLSPVIPVENGTLRVIVGRGQEMQVTINIIFSGLLVIALFLMGLEIDLKIIWNVLKKPIGPAIGFVSQFVFMPLCAYGLAKAFLLHPHEQLGLILLGACPGGAASNFWTAMFDGDVNLSVTMTLVSSVASFGMTSFWAWLLGSHLISAEGSKDPSKNIEIPYHMIAISLISFVIPLGIGVLVRYLKPQKAKRIHDIAAKPFFIACLIVLPVVGIWNSQFMFWLLTWRHVLTGFLIGNLGYVFGAGLAWICRQKRPQIIAISLETALQNGGIAFVVMNLTFVSPYADVGVLPVIGYFMCSTTPILFLLYFIYIGYKCCTGQTSLKQIREDFKSKKEKAKGKASTEVVGTEMKSMKNDFDSENNIASQNLLEHNHKS